MKTTLEEVREAYENLSDDDKKAFHQTIADRVHESIAAQEEDEGQTDSQTAEDREHEALGAEHADAEKEHEEADEEVAKATEKHDDALGERLDRIEAALAKLIEDRKDPLDEKREKYGMATRPVQRTEKTYTERDVDRLLGK